MNDYHFFYRLDGYSRAMFPNFTSLAQREQKRLSLLEKAELRKRQSTQKRDMYESTQWASDANKTIDITSKRTTSIDTQTTESVSPIDPSKKVSIASESQTDVQDSGDIKAFAETGINTDRSNLNDIGTNTSRVSTTETGTDAFGTQTADAGTNTFRTQTADADTNTDSVKKDTPPQKTHDEIIQLEAKESIKRWYIDHPDWQAIRVNPILLDGKRASSFFIGRRGAIYRLSSQKKTTASIVNFIDWVATLQQIRDIYYDEESNTIDEIGSMNLEDRAARDILNREIDTKNQEAELDEMAVEDRDSRYLRGPANAGWKRSMPIHDPRDPKHQGYETILIDKRTQSSHDQIDSLAKLMVLIRAYRDVIKPMIIHLMMRDGFHFEKS